MHSPQLPLATRAGLEQWPKPIVFANVTCDNNPAPDVVLGAYLLEHLIPHCEQVRSVFLHLIYIHY